MAVRNQKAYYLECRAYLDAVAADHPTLVKRILDAQYEVQYTESLRAVRYTPEREQDVLDARRERQAALDDLAAEVAVGRTLQHRTKRDTATTTSRPKRANA